MRSNVAKEDIDAIAAEVNKARDEMFRAVDGRPVLVSYLAAKSCVAYYETRLFVQEVGAAFGDMEKEAKTRDADR